MSQLTKWSPPMEHCSAARSTRRACLRDTSLVCGAAWLTPLASALAREAETPAAKRSGDPPQSVILLWLIGGPSQLETFDPHPGTRIAGGSRAIETILPGVKVGAGLPRVAEQLDCAAIVRSLNGKEGDHNRALYLAKTGYRPDPVTFHPSVGAICAHQLPLGNTEIPRHVSILSGQNAGRGGFLGAGYDAFKIGDPANPVPDVESAVSNKRLARRMSDLEVLERGFSAGRAQAVEDLATHTTVEQARAIMSSEQLAAFDVEQEPAELRAAYGDTPFGRGCLAARRLIEVGVRCVEVTLSGWDTHINNHELHANLLEVLDPALATLLADLRQRAMLERTVVVCMGEFGRTPKVNALDGRDHWPHAYSALMAGGGLNRGLVIGETDPEGGREVANPYRVADLHATVYESLGIDIALENLSRAQRPIKISEGTPIPELIAS